MVNITQEMRVTHERVDLYKDCWNGEMSAEERNTITTAAERRDLSSLPGESSTLLRHRLSLALAADDIAHADRSGEDRGEDWKMPAVHADDTVTRMLAVLDTLPFKENTVGAASPHMRMKSDSSRAL